MAEFEKQMANIEAMLQQILKNTGAEPEEDEEEDRCPTCGHMAEGGPKGKMLIVMSKKKLKPGQMPEIPSVLKDVLKALSSTR